MPDSDAIRLPGPTHKTAIVGRNGSGKTLAAIYHLSRSDFDERPWVILDFKNDEHINAITRAERISFDDVPDEPGIYILKVTPGNKERVSEWFKRAWEHENIGIVVDEGYRVDQHDEWFNGCLTQGRSKRISMIVLSQRPVWVSRFVFSEADFFQVFDLTHKKDRDIIGEYIRDDERERLEIPLEPYTSFWYDVAGKRLDVVGKVPSESSMLEDIDTALADLEYEEEFGEAERPRRRPL
jgi:hypothetical protein